ncbi:hypothetical protein D322_3645 [Yersinia enterocolitica IP 10393]|nr:hypothetical protein D322_3645 [Yersinia enterocolitica IP 10393]
MSHNLYIGTQENFMWEFSYMKFHLRFVYYYQMAIKINLL